MRWPHASVWHPPLVAIYPVIYLYAANPGQSPFPWLLVGFLAVGAAAAALALGGLIGHRTKAALLVSFGLVLAYSYGHVFEGLRSLPGEATLAASGILRHRTVLAAYAIAFAAGVALLLKTRRNLGPLGRLLTAVTVIGLAMSGGSVAIFEARAARLAASAGSLGAADESTSRPLTVQARPNIYYMILDGRASSAVLQQYFGHSDAAFTDYLRQRGFYIASRSHANYSMTFLSLASSLNMDYLDRLGEAVGRDSTDETLARRMITDNRLARMLKARGYRIVNVSSGWGPTNRLSTVDDNLMAGDPLAEFYDVFVQTTILGPLRLRQARDAARGRVLRSFAGLRRLDKHAQPMFVFAHILAPHPPFVFGAAGEPVTPPKLGLFGAAWKLKNMYIDQLTFVDGQVREIVERILAESDRPPVIVIQSDHGPASSGDLTRPTDEFLRERMPIFNAYYLPGPARERLYDAITPVNSFRVVLNAYLDARLPILPDAIHFSDQDHPYRFRDITSLLLGERR